MDNNFELLDTGVGPANGGNVSEEQSFMSNEQGELLTEIRLFRNNKLRDERAKPTNIPNSFSRITVLKGRVGLFRNNKLRDKRAKSTKNPNSFSRITLDSFGKLRDERAKPTNSPNSFSRITVLKGLGKETIDNNFELLDTGVVPANGDNDSKEQSYEPMSRANC
ncbi:hypothetical protein CEXT_78101 [Caerostris extrusa]|uniref:Uncharacterized protein n=1 Tax=Caerostris extrusa TaxID=172846 RepID=A0AAV4MXQ1_CAEEX|nr:hypothetical protein CEXT_78101 [Caerostris extrusa]